MLFCQQLNYSFVSSKKYSNKRHIIDNIDVKETDGTTCVKPISKYLTFSYVCNDDNNYFVENKDVVNNGSKEVYDNYSVYNKSNKYYVWDGYGIKNVLSKKEIHFLDKEHYDIYTLKDLLPLGFGLRNLINSREI